MTFKSIKRLMKDDCMTYDQAVDEYASQIDQSYDEEKDRRFGGNRK